MEQTIYEALKRLRSDIPDLVELLKLGHEQEVETWTDMIDAKLLTRFSPGFPIVAAICGGGSSGKSTLFNSLLGEKLAPIGGRAGMNRRLLFSVPASCLDPPDFMANLIKPGQTTPEPLKDQDDLLTPGTPLYVSHQSEFRNMVLFDTPDFDTGAKGSYTNREVTQDALEASDILIYIFTNSNYNNRDNMDFICQMLTGIGRRKCFLIYRVYPSFSDQEVHDHAMIVARGIYGDDADQYLLGIYRTDEDNQVAAGEKFMTLRSLRSRDPDFWKALEAIDTHQLRFELHASILNDVLERSANLLENANVSLDELRLFFDSLQTAQSHWVHEALKHFPMDRVLKRFARIWSETDPSHVKMMRKTGALIEFPLKVVLSTAGWAKRQLYSEKSEASVKDFADKLDEDLVTAVTGMHHQAVSPQMRITNSINDPAAQRMLETIGHVRAWKGLKNAQSPRADAAGEGTAYHFVVDAHPSVLSEQQNLQAKDFKSILQSIRAQKNAIAGISREMEDDLKNLADHFRSKMSLWAKISQTFWAFMNVLPATVAVTYVLSTGDPLGAAGIKIKLTGLFGAKDLYALFAIPATTGMKKADQKQLEIMLGPIVETWLNHKLKIVQDLFEEHITGNILHMADKSIAEAKQRINDLENSLERCKKGVLQR
ncbi:MAG: hypothetical protein JSV83_09510 [Desulfobacterales bacterium]|nr:MAG: hypothetical protein JSV83_09510 [Desulfobacterales bacterium]